MIFVISHISNLSEVQQDEYVTPACCKTFQKAGECTYLNMDSILVLGSWNFKKTQKTRTRINGHGARTIDQYEYHSTTFVISNT